MENSPIIEKRESLISKEFLFKIKNHWFACLVSLIVCIFISIIINHYTLPVYNVSTTILLKREKPLLEIQGSQGIGSLESQLMVSNEVEAIKSIWILEKALSNLDFGVSYYQKVPFDMRELYKSCPFQIIPDSLHPQISDTFFNVLYNSDSTFVLSIDAKNVSILNLISQQTVESYPEIKFAKTYHCNTKINEDLFSFKFVQNKKIKGLKGESYWFSIQSKEAIISTYRNLSVTSLNNSTVLRLSIEGNNIPKLVDLLNKVSEAFLEKSIEKKNISAINTVKFIDNQLIIMSDSLRFAEKKLQDYQSSHKVMDIDFLTQQIYSSLDESQKEKAELTVKLKYLNYLKDYFEKNNDNDQFITPATFGLDNSTLQTILDELKNRIDEKNQLKFILKKDIPNVSTDDGTIEGIKKTVIENVNNMISAINFSISESDKKINEVSEKAMHLPQINRELFEYKKTFQLNNDICTMLLNKKSDIQITKAGLVPDHEIINPANARDTFKVSPNEKRNLMLAIILGLGIPIIIILINDYFNEKIRSISDIERVTNFPILGHIIRNKSESFDPVLEEPNSLIAESFRSLRTNFQFVAVPNDKHVILITSSIMDEGKSYVSLNLASSFALFGKKTILLSFDLRKPIRSLPFGLKNDIGISTFLSNNCTLDKCINKTTNENLNIILPGPIPPNPNELIASNYTKELIENLVKDYDYIIIDTPPIGMIADALLLFKYADVKILMVRHNTTNKSMLHNIASTLTNRKIENVNIIINDLPVIKNKYGYGYSYGYGYNHNYGYGYGYYNKQNIKNNIFRKIFRNS